MSFWKRHRKDGDGDGNVGLLSVLWIFQKCPWFLQLGFISFIVQEIAFSTESVQSEDGTSGYQSTLDCKFFEAGGYLGEVCASKKAAEHSAARVAIEHEFRDFVEGVETLGKNNWHVGKYVYCYFCFGGCFFVLEVVLGHQQQFMGHFCIFLGKLTL